MAIMRGEEVPDIPVAAAVEPEEVEEVEERPASLGRDNVG